MKQFSKEERIAYYRKRIEHAQKRIKALESQVQESPDQDWTERVTAQILEALQKKA